MKKQLLLFYFLLFSFYVIAQDKGKPTYPTPASILSTNLIPICDIIPNLNSSNSLCYTGNFSFSTSTTGNYTYTGGPQANYGCLYSQPNQTWFVITITGVTSSTQTLNFTFPNNNSYDIDAAIWGPIYQNNLANACASLYNSPISCDYDTEDPDLTITNATVGQKYLLVITNYENTSNVLQITQPNGGTVQYCTPSCPTVPTPSISASTTNISCGQNVTLSAFGCNATTAWSNGLTGNSISVSPTTNSTYTATCSNNGCISASSNPVNITIQNLEAPFISASSTSISCGQSAILTSTGCTGTVNWSDGSTGTSLTVYPTTETVYSAICKVDNCTSPTSNTKTISLSNTVSPTITPGSAVDINCGGSNTLTASGCNGGTLNWSNGSTWNTITVSPHFTTTYSVTCTIAGCKSNPVSETIFVNAIYPPNVSASATSISCGQSITLTVSGGCLGTIKWSNGLVGTSVTITPIQTTTYKVVCSSSSSTCPIVSVQSAGVIVTVNGVSAPTVSASSTNISCGQSTTIYASGCSGGVINWSDGNTGSSRTITPYNNLSYTATCTNSSGCTSGNSNTVTISISSVVVPAISASTTSIGCGGSTTLTATGCNGTINWSNGNVGSSTLVFPIVNTSYTATCIKNGCTSYPSNAITVTVINTPPPTIVASSINVSCGQSTTLTATGCSGTISWKNGNPGSSITIFPTITTSYIAYCNNNNGCMNTISNSITVSVVSNNDNDNTYQTATIVTTSPFTSETLSLCMEGDQDWFKIFVYNKYYYAKVRGDRNTYTGAYIFKYTNNKGVIELETIPSNGSYTDTYIELYDSDGVSILRGDDDSGEGNFSKLSYCFPILSLTHALDDYINQSSPIIQRASASISGKIIATNWIQGSSTKVTYEGRTIELKPGFIVDAGTVFVAQTGGCNEVNNAVNSTDSIEKKEK